MKLYKTYLFEWIPYNQLNEIEETVALKSLHDSQNTIEFVINKAKKYSYGYEDISKVALRCLHNSQNTIRIVRNEVKKYLRDEFKDPIDFLINEAKKYLVTCDIYGISQDLNTNNYILVLTWASGNEKIDDFIREMNTYEDTVIEWIPYDQLNEIKEIGKNSSISIYSAIWKDGPLYYDDQNSNDYTRDPSKEVSLKYLQNTQNSVESLIKEAKKYLTKNGAFMLLNDPNKVIALKCLHNSQNITNKFLNEAKEYSMTKGSNITNIYGISQNPDTEDYILVLGYAKDGNFNNWMNENYEYFIWQNKVSVLLV
ncbi:kinase-like domain-containing protein [Rhizophagus irregularis DAOM 181602=DAOM 197198]|nr:kinase-like domain-containing protein [Rhizophagus irregularis DAOM 181602=DAOM 197198]